MPITAKCRPETRLNGTQTGQLRSCDGCVAEGVEAIGISIGVIEPGHSLFEFGYRGHICRGLVHTRSDGEVVQRSVGDHLLAGLADLRKIVGGNWARIKRTYSDPCLSDRDKVRATQFSRWLRRGR